VSVICVNNPKTSDESKWSNNEFWLPPYNWIEEVRKNFDLPKRVYVHDATLREGDQHPGIAMRKDDKVALATALDDLGVNSIEIAPMISNADKEAARAIAKLGLNAKLICFTSWNTPDIDAAVECEADGVILDFPGNPWQGKVFWGITPEQQVEKASEAIRYAKSRGLFVIALPWDDYRAPFDYLEKDYKAIVKAGADHVTLTETYGFSLPWTTTYMVRKIREWIPGIPIEKHGHNDYGLGTGDMLAAVSAGAEVVQTTMCGIGERAGNAATEEVAVAIELLLGVKTGIDLKKIYRTAQLFQDITGYTVAPTKPIIGKNIFNITSGWVAWMKARAREAGKPTGMVPFMPDVIGAPPQDYIIGKGSGRGLIRMRLDQLGLKVSDPQLDAVTERVKEQSMLRRRALSDNELVWITSEIQQQKT